MKADDEIPSIYSATDPTFQTKCVRLYISSDAYNGRLLTKFTADEAL